MAYKLSRREYVMVGVLAVAGILALYFGRGSGLGFGGGEEAPVEMAVLGDPPMVQMARLTYETEAYDSRGRNLFQYSSPPRPKVEKTAVTPPAAPVRKPQPKVTPPQQRKPAPPARPQPPKIPFKYLGFLGPKDAKIAVFEQNEEILLARTGEVVKDKFRLLEFKYEGVLMGYVDERFQDETTELTRKRR